MAEKLTKRVKSVSLRQTEIESEKGKIRERTLIFRSIHDFLKGRGTTRE